jgi:ABC-type multidrug transport system fused ATPase/permease subunit
MLVSVTTFATYGLLMGEELEAARVFTALVYFNILRTPLGILPCAISSLLSGRVSLTRIQNFLLTEEVREEKRETTSPSVSDLTPSIISITPTTSIIIEDGEFSWGTPPPPSETDSDLEEPVSPPSDSSNLPSPLPATISDINIHINKGELVMIVGAVGSGKSSLLSAILGEITKVKGKVFRRGRKGYCTQQAWIQNATLVDNILFGQDCDIHFLDQVRQVSS